MTLKSVQYSVTLSTFTMLGNDPSYPFPELVHHLKQKLSTHSTVTPHSPPGNFCSMNLTTVGASYKWNHALCPFVCGLLHLESAFTGHSCHSPGLYFLPPVDWLTFPTVHCPPLPDVRDSLWEQREDSLAAIHRDC